MAKVLVEETNLENIADSIRAKNGTQETYLPSEMSTAIDNLPSGGGGDYNAKIDGSITYYASYGMKGLISEVDLEGVNLTSLNKAFQSWRGLKTIKNITTSTVTDFYYMCQGCKELITAPSMNTQNGKNFSSMFMQCEKLQNVPVYDWSCIDLKKGDDIQLAFYGCNVLTNESLNNILATCISATHITSNKTLSNIGLSSTQIATCQTLSNWDAFVSAGWSA